MPTSGSAIWPPRDRRGRASPAFVVLVDVPSIKRYVFGTDPLNEVRGASARLDWLNQEEMGRILCQDDGLKEVDTIYANGGSAQFVVRARDERAVATACRSVVRHIRQQTGGEVRAVYGIAPLPDDASYRSAVRSAHFRMRYQRDVASGYCSTSTMPAIMECESASHLPAACRIDHGADGIRMLSEASRQKADEGRTARTAGLWNKWMRHLQGSGPWPAPEHWQELRCKDLTVLGERASWRNYIGVVYADGNAMGKIVQALDMPETCRQFSKIVDESIREACFSGLGAITRTEVERVRQSIPLSDPMAPLPADILLLGGDDLLVAVPADRALDFALHVTDTFEQLTRSRITALQGDAGQFFRERLGVREFTISCGVAIARSSYPFYLSLDLAEQLLRRAKRSAPHGAAADACDPVRIDFHLVAGGNSHKLDQVRKDAFHTATEEPRTLRPMTRSQLALLRAAVGDLRQAGFPRSKLHQLLDAGLTARASQAERGIRDIFARCRFDSGHPERQALWNSVMSLCPDGYHFDFPWFRKGSRRLLCVPDIADAYDLFRSQTGSSR